MLVISNITGHIPVSAIMLG